MRKKKRIMTSNYVDKKKKHNTNHVMNKTNTLRETITIQICHNCIRIQHICVDLVLEKCDEIDIKKYVDSDRMNIIDDARYTININK